MTKPTLERPFADLTTQQLVAEIGAYTDELELSMQRPDAFENILADMQAVIAELARR